MFYKVIQIYNTRIHLMIVDGKLHSDIMKRYMFRYSSKHDNWALRLNFGDEPNKIFHFISNDHLRYKFIPSRKNIANEVLNLCLPCANNSIIDNVLQHILEHGFKCIGSHD